MSLRLKSKVYSEAFENVNRSLTETLILVSVFVNDTTNELKHMTPMVSVISMTLYYTCYYLQTVHAVLFGTTAIT